MRSYTCVNGDINTIILLQIGNQHPDIKKRQCYKCYRDLSVNVNEVMLTGRADASYPDADLDAS